MTFTFRYAKRLVEKEKKGGAQLAVCTTPFLQKYYFKVIRRENTPLSVFTDKI
jgi:hypothetical protein